jgi:hypothetical protein
MRKRAATKATFPNVVDAMEDPRLFGPMFAGPSWANWRTILRGAFALPMTESELEFFRTVTDRDPPAKRVKELVVIAGRRSGKDSVASAIAAYSAATFRKSGKVRPGERPRVILVGADRAQARAQLAYCKGYFSEIEPFKAMVTRETADGLELSSGIDLVVQTCDHRSARGATCLLAIGTETAFWASETSSSPDTEVFRALQPSLATLDGESMMILISSAYKRSGLLYDRWKRFYGVDDPNTLIVHAKTRDLNPLISEEVIAAAFADDPESAKAELDSLWRDDLAGFLTLPEIEAITDRGVPARKRVNGVQYTAWLDASSGAGKDSFCASIGHKEGENCVIDRVIEIRPPFSPPSAVALIASELSSFGIRRATADRWGLAFVASEFERHQIALEYSDKNSSEIFRQALPIIRSGRARLIDNPRMINQFVNLERRILPGGGERIGHPERGGHHDDIAVVVSGCLVALAAPLTGAEGWIEFYRRQVEEPGRHNTDLDDVMASGPAFGFSFSSAPLVKLVLPPGPIAAAGSLYTNRAGLIIARRIGDQTIAEVSREDAVDLLKGNVAWRNANEDLSRELLGETSNEN